MKILPFLFASLFALAAYPAERQVLEAKPGGREVEPAVMEKIYGEVKTPFKHGVVLRGKNGQLVDCPSVFRWQDHWLMMYVSMDKAGYETYLAKSTNLLEWQPLGKILSFRKETNCWDQWQADGGMALIDTTWDGSMAPESFAGKYWLSYIGGAKQGYEPDPLSIGLAWTLDPSRIKEWTRLPENPVLSPDQEDVREFEKKTLYKSTIIHDRRQSLGFPLVMFYNAKVKNGYERIGIAVSKDMVHWQRYGNEPVVSNGDDKRNGMSGDPQIVRIGDVWVMFYFGAGWKAKAFDTFACSYDLVRWTKWTGEDLVKPSEPFDKTYAHKPWVLKHNGVVYHYYCAVGDEGRVIALATSKDLKK